MFQIDIAADPFAQMARSVEEARMLAGAVVEEGGGLAARADQRFDAGLVIGHMAAALEIVDAATNALQPSLHQFYMPRLAIVRRAGKGNLRHRHIISVGG